jgi:hypothetical protein
LVTRDEKIPLEVRKKNIEEILNFLKYVGHSFQVRHKVDKIIYIYIYIYIMNLTFPPQLYRREDDENAKLSK